MGRSACARGAGIMSGRAVPQQGSTTTCKDRATKGTPKRAEGGGLAHEPVRAMTERQRSPRRSLRSPWLTPKAKGLWVLGGFDCRSRTQTPIWDTAVCAIGTRARADPSGSASSYASTLPLRPGGKGPGPETACEPRSEPDSGNATVRDRREACGNVVYGGAGNPPRNRKGGSGNPPPTDARITDLSRHPHVRIRGRPGWATTRAHPAGRGCAGIEPARIDLADVTDEFGLVATRLAEEVGQATEQLVVGERRQRVSAFHADNIGRRSATSWYRV